jgi:hypothetical protein
MGQIWSNTTPILNIDIFSKINDDMYLWLKHQPEVTSFAIGMNMKKDIELSIYSNLTVEEIKPTLPPSIRKYRIILQMKPPSYIRLS